MDDPYADEEIAAGDPRDSDETLPPPAPRDVATVTTEGLGVRRFDQWLVRNLTLSVAPGSVVTVEGPAGSGHSKVLLALSGRVAADEGSVAVLGGGGAVGWIPELGMLDEQLTVAETMNECAGATGATESAVADALELTDLRGWEDVLCAYLTTPQRVRLGMAWALLSRPVALAVDATVGGPDDSLFALAFHIAKSGCVVLLGTAVPDAPSDMTIRLQPSEVTS
ncbi:MAG: ATP-binding cassette domain-containing protein [Candidatus Nanopelagicales bacterium]|nr:ATP-binding cassette domain-containing protein [Candidatus Nanopelagicales bacterium]